MRKTQRLILITLLLCTCFPVSALPVDVVTARKRAEVVLGSHSARNAQHLNIELKYQSSTSYLFTNGTDFALIAADSELPQVLGYGQQQGDEVPPALKAYMQTAKYAVPVNAQKKFTPVAPLLPFVRHQEAPYNNFCPFYKNKEGIVSEKRCMVGCVATALEEVISYYRRVETLQDTLKGWETPNYVIEDVLPGTSVDTRLIQNNYDIDDYTAEEADAVARLSYYCGVAAHMNWGLDESGANVSRLVEPMKKAFGYQYVEFVDSYKYRSSDWLKMMRNEMYAHRPVLYAAFVMKMGGHAFAIDGLDEDGFFHVNWGYGGSHDGFFCLDVLNFSEPPQHATPEGLEAGFFTNHQALLLHPEKVEATLPDTLARSGHEVVVDSVTFEFPAETGKLTPIAVYLRNTTDLDLTTPFEFFTNAPEDTALLEQGDFLALSGARLAPYEKRKIVVHARFNKSGNRILRISPDDVVMLYEDSLKVNRAVASKLEFDEPSLSFPEEEQVFISFKIRNKMGGGRSGQDLHYDMVSTNENGKEEEIRHTRKLYLMPGEEHNDTITFHHLTPGKNYTLRIRSPWTIVKEMKFKLPEVSGILSPEWTEENAPVTWYSIDGRQLQAPQQTGIYLRRQGNHTKKIYISK